MYFPGVLKQGLEGIGYIKDFLSIYLDYAM